MKLPVSNKGNLAKYYPGDVLYSEPPTRIESLYWSSYFSNVAIRYTPQFDCSFSPFIMFGHDLKSHVKSLAYAVWNWLVYVDDQLFPVHYIFDPHWEELQDVGVLPLVRIMPAAVSELHWEVEFYHPEYGDGNFWSLGNVMSLLNGSVTSWHGTRTSGNLLRASMFTKGVDLNMLRDMPPQEYTDRHTAPAVKHWLLTHYDIPVVSASSIYHQLGHDFVDCWFSDRFGSQNPFSKWALAMRVSLGNTGSGFLDTDRESNMMADWFAEDYCWCDSDVNMLKEEWDVGKEYRQAYQNINKWIRHNRKRATSELGQALKELNDIAIQDYIKNGSKGGSDGANV